MPLYVDLGVVRIQEYILRSHRASDGQLRKRRGASQMISAATESSAFAAYGFSPNGETYDTEGVAHLVDVRPEAVEDVEVRVTRCLLQLRRALPEAHLSASWAVADSYAVAHERIAGLATAGRLDTAAELGIIDWMPPVREEHRSTPCGGCGAAPALTKGQCADCAERDRHGARGDGTVRDGDRRASRDHVTRDAVATLVQSPHLSLPADLGSLAKLNPYPHAKSNHLATVYADGNNVGAAFRALVEDPEAARAMSSILDTAIKAAGQRAIAATWEQLPPNLQGTFPAQVTVLAADDALVTVPAPLAWTFVTTLLRTFNSEVATQVKTRLPERANSLPRLTLTAGVVFSHVKSPIEAAIAAANATMRTAKRAYAGQQSAIGWRDLTQQGHSLIDTNRTIDWFDAHSDMFAQLRSWPGSHWSKWLIDITNADAQGVSKEDLLRYLRSEAKRLDHSWPGIDDVSLEDLAAMIGASRWWPPETAIRTERGMP